MKMARSSLPGLYAIGEVACTGLHGANRLASNSLLEACVLAHRCCEAIAGERLPIDDSLLDTLELPEWDSGDGRGRGRTGRHLPQLGRNPPPDVGLRRHRPDRPNGCSAPPRGCAILEREIQEFYWDFKITTDLLELRNLATVAALIVDSALLRKESRGLHYTLDFPEPDERFRRFTVLRRH